MKKLLVIFISLFLLYSCGQSPQNSETASQQPELVNKVDSYKIISETENVNPKIGINKCNIDVELTERISEVKLMRIAYDLRKTRKSYDYLWIFYYLPDMKIGSGCWATSHFTPDLDVKILGATAEEAAKMKETSDNVDGKIIGKFFEQQYTSCTYVVYKKDNKLFIKTIRKDGTSDVVEMKRKKIDGGIRLDYKEGGYNGEYLILSDKGILEFYNAENKMFTTAQKL